LIYFFASCGYYSSFNTAKKITRIKLLIICFILRFYDGFFAPEVGNFHNSFEFFISLTIMQAAAMIKVFNLATVFGRFTVFAIEGKIIL
jgi:hypothetical protein